MEPNSEATRQECRRRLRGPRIDRRCRAVSAERMSHRPMGSHLQRKTRQQHPAFTLIELLVVVAILSAADQHSSAEPGECTGAG